MYINVNLSTFIKKNKTLAPRVLFVIWKMLMSPLASSLTFHYFCINIIFPSRSKIDMYRNRSTIRQSLFVDSILVSCPDITTLPLKIQNGFRFVFVRTRMILNITCIKGIRP